MRQGFFSQSQLSVQTLLRCSHSPSVQSRTSTSAPALKIPVKQNNNNNDIKQQTNKQINQNPEIKPTTTNYKNTKTKQKTKQTTTTTTTTTTSTTTTTKLQKPQEKSLKRKLLQSHICLCRFKRTFRSNTICSRSFWIVVATATDTGQTSLH